MPRVSTPVFNGAPTDVTKVVDAFTTTDSTVRTSVTEYLSAFGEELSRILSGSTSAISSIGSQLTSGFTTVAEAEARVNSALSSARSMVSKLTTSTQNAITEKLTGLTTATNAIKTANTLVNSVKVTVNNVESTVKNIATTQANGILAIANDLVGTNSFVSKDLGVNVALNSTVLSEIASWKTPELLSSVLNSADDLTKFDIVKESSTAIASSGNVANVTAIQDLGYGSALTSNNSNFISTLLSNYTKDSTSNTTLSSQGDELSSALSKLTESWLTATRNGTTVTNLDTLTTASNDAKSALSASSTTSEAATIASLYKTNIDAIATLKSMYSGIALT